MKTKVTSMIEGNPSKLILTFAFPLMIGNIFQQLYTNHIYKEKQNNHKF